MAISETEEEDKGGRHYFCCQEGQKTVEDGVGVGTTNTKMTKTTTRTEFTSEERSSTSAV